MEDSEPEPVILCSQARHPVVGWDINPVRNLQSMVNSTSKYAEDNEVQDLWEKTNNGGSDLRSMPQKGTHAEHHLDDHDLEGE